jgi:hypothetical protein
VQHNMQKLPFVATTDSSPLALGFRIRRMLPHLLLHLLILLQLVSELSSSCLTKCDEVTPGLLSKTFLFHLIPAN